jgi:NADPH:quinone reductase-like Zn-dependent oxidoreductase
VRGLGADEVVDYGAVDVFAAAGPPFDVIVDIAGNPSLARLRRRLAPRGRVAFVGGEHGGATFGMERVLLGALLAPWVGQRFSLVMPKEHFAPLEALAALVDAGHVRPSIERRVGLDGVAEGVRAMPTRAPRGKVVVVPASV